MTEEKPIRILIVDDHAMVRSGLKNFIYAYDWMDPIGEAGDGAQAVAFCKANDVDVVLMDIMMPVMDGCEAIRQIITLGKPINIIVLTSFHEQDAVEQALKAGATSYLMKNVSAEELAQAIRFAHAGRSILSPEAAEALIMTTRQRADTSVNLTRREKDVLKLLVDGQSNADISKHLSISIATTKFHIMNIFSKLGVKSRLEAVTIALKQNLVDDE